MISIARIPHLISLYPLHCDINTLQIPEPSNSRSPISFISGVLVVYLPSLPRKSPLPPTPKSIPLVGWKVQSWHPSAARKTPMQPLAPPRLELQVGRFALCQYGCASHACRLSLRWGGRGGVDWETRLRHLPETPRSAYIQSRDEAVGWLGCGEQANQRLLR
jgi:hypothetical protein